MKEVTDSIMTALQEAGYHDNRYCGFVLAVCISSLITRKFEYDCALKMVRRLQ